METDNLRLHDQRRKDCIAAPLIEDDDFHCYSFDKSSNGYEVISEDSADVDEWMAEVRGLTFDNIKPYSTALPELPSYIPTVTKGSHELFSRYRPHTVAVGLSDVVSEKQLRVCDSLKQRFGIPTGTNVLLLCYGKDKLIENIWPDRHRVFYELSKLGFAAVTGINYSIWDSDPHLERLINLKRSLITYNEWQRLSLSAIPHIYWYGYKDLDRLAEWLNCHPVVKTVAINLQTLKRNCDWHSAMKHLRYLLSRLEQNLHFLITGPQNLHRIRELCTILPSVTFNNSGAVNNAWSSRILILDETVKKRAYSPQHKSALLKLNSEFYHSVIQNMPSMHASTA